MIGWELLQGGAEVLDLLPDNGRVSGREDAGQGLGAGSCARRLGLAPGLPMRCLRAPVAPGRGRIADRLENA